MKQIASLGSMHETGRSGLVQWDDPGGWDGEGCGRGVQDGEHMYTHEKKSLMPGTYLYYNQTNCQALTLPHLSNQPWDLMVRKHAFGDCLF